MNIGPRLNPYPTRQMVVSDPSKLNYFAQANAARFGVKHSAGALNGFAETAPSSGDVMSSKEATSLGTGIGAGVGALLRNLFPPPSGYTGTDGTAGTTTTTVVKDNTILGLPPAVAIGGGLAVAAFIVWRMSK